MSAEVRGRRVLLTGATGFVGANLARAFSRRGAEVIVLIRSDSDVWRIADILGDLTVAHGDLTDADTTRRIVRQARPELIVHAAASSIHHPSDPEARLSTVESTVNGTVNLLEAVRPLPFERFIHLGSSLEYGPRDRPLVETDLLLPTTERGATKAAAGILATQFALEGQRPLTSLRLFSVYGCWEGHHRLIPTLVRAALEKREVKLTAGESRRDLIFVDDVVDACLLAVGARCAPGSAFNIGTGRQWTNRAVVDTVEAITGTRIAVREGDYGARPSDTPNWVADPGEARRALGWSPRYDLVSGLEQFIAWYAETPSYRRAPAEP